MIRFGPAGIPLSCKGRTLDDGIKDVHNLSLTAIEAQMVRPTSTETYPDDEHIGKTISEIEDELIIKIIRDDEMIFDSSEPIEEDDIIVTMASSLAHNFGEIIEVGNRAKRLDVDVSMHAPKYIDLGSNTAITDKNIDDIIHAGQIVTALGGNVVVTNLGLYKKDIPAEDIEANIVENLGVITEMWQDYGFTPKIGLEVSASENTYGSLDQILDLCDEFSSSVIPVLNFSNYHARNNGCLNEVADFENVIQQVLPYNNGKLYAQFAGVETSLNNDVRFTPIKKGNLKFELLADCLADSRPEATIISTSPLLEHDAMYMRIFYERMINKRVAKDLRQKKKEMEAAAAPADEAEPASKEESAPKKKKRAVKKAEPASEIDG